MGGFAMRAIAGGESPVTKLLHKHFDNIDASGIVSAVREFPATSRVDVQEAIEDFFKEQAGTRLISIQAHGGPETMGIAQLYSGGPFPANISPLQYDEVDVGDPAPVRCLKNGLWLARTKLPYAVLMASATHFGQNHGVHVELAVLAGEPGARFSEEWFRELERRVGAGRTYRGRVLSLENYHDFRGRGGAIKVHRLHKVNRGDVILPQKTLDLLDRNVNRFVAARKRIRGLRLPTKKGLLFYGPPGTGKTHTIHYLASQLPEHTTLLITAEQVALLGEYFRLARFLQPAMVVIEDVDLIGRERAQLQTPFQEAMLNKLLNEMDGLREDADVLFILTTNRPDQLEPALAARPGRVDQAIEFPLPDEDGRKRLAKLYARGLETPLAVMDLIVRRTAGASAAFIKELMRRSAQFQIEAGTGDVLSEASVDAAIEEMVFSGGELNRKLLGAGPETGGGALRGSA